MSKSKQPYISVVIPALNEAGYLPRALESLARQRYRNFETIVVDNGSTDDTATIAESLGAKVVSEPRRGLPMAREAGRRQARGEIIVNLDADSVLSHDYLQQIYQYFESHPNHVAVTNALEFDGGKTNLKLITAIFFKLIFPLYRFILAGFNQALLFGGNFAVRAAALAKVGGFNTNLEFFGEDSEVAKRFAKAGRIGYRSDIITLTSPRRFNADGTFKLLYTYIRHHLAIVFFNKPAKSHSWKWAVRVGQVFVTSIAVLLVFELAMPVISAHAASGAHHFGHTLDNMVDNNFHKLKKH